MKEYTINKYKPLPKFYFGHRPPPGLQGGIVSIMTNRGYSLYMTLDVDKEKIRSFKKYVNDYLNSREAEDDYYYVWYVAYPTYLLESKYLYIFRKKLIY